MSLSSSEQRRRAQVQVLAAELYREHRERLLRIARRNAANPEDAAEAVQFAFRPCFTLPSLSLSLIKQSSLGA
jgi:DNA-directed RNA polymerase specialized sigma24 family protein